MGALIVFNIHSISNYHDNVTYEFKRILEKPDIYTILWSNEIRFMPAHVIQKDLNIKYDEEIIGHIDDMKSMKHIRSIHKTDKELLSKPMLLIDTHTKSLDYGGFDYSFNINKYKTSGYNYTYNFDNLAIDVQNKINEWYGKKTFKPIYTSVE